MTRLLHRLRALALARRTAPIVGGIAAGAVAVTSLITQDWETAAWAGIATVWAFLYAAHSCPPPPLPARGVQYVHFNGGPMDGGTGVVPGIDRDLHESTLVVDGADYRLGTVEQTCYTAEHSPGVTE